MTSVAGWPAHADWPDTRGPLWRRSAFRSV